MALGALGHPGPLVHSAAPAGRPEPSCCSRGSPQPRQARLAGPSHRAVVPGPPTEDTSPSAWRADINNVDGRPKAFSSYGFAAKEGAGLGAARPDESRIAFSTSIRQHANRR